MGVSTICYSQGLSVPETAASAAELPALGPQPPWIVYVRLTVSNGLSCRTPAIQILVPFSPTTAEWIPPQISGLESEGPTPFMIIQAPATQYAAPSTWWSRRQADSGGWAEKRSRVESQDLAPPATIPIASDQAGSDLGTEPFIRPSHVRRIYDTRSSPSSPVDAADDHRAMDLASHCRGRPT